MTSEEVNPYCRMRFANRLYSRDAIYSGHDHVTEHQIVIVLRDLRY